MKAFHSLPILISVGFRLFTSFVSPAAATKGRNMLQALPVREYMITFFSIRHATPLSPIQMTRQMKSQPQASIIVIFKFLLDKPPGTVASKMLTGSLKESPKRLKQILLK